jgi:hypothetical protein
MAVPTTLKPQIMKQQGQTVSTQEDLMLVNSVHGHQQFS